MKPLTPKSLISRRASRAPIFPRAGSMLANGMATSACSAASSATSSLVIRRWPISFSLSTVNTTNAIFRSR